MQLNVFIAEFDLCDISLSINTNPSTSPQRTPLNVDNVEVHLGTTQLDFGLCKPVDQTSRFVVVSFA